MNFLYNREHNCNHLLQFCMAHILYYFIDIFSSFTTTLKYLNDYTFEPRVMSIMLQANSLLFAYYSKHDCIFPKS